MAEYNQIWNSQIIHTSDRNSNKLSKDDFESVFFQNDLLTLTKCNQLGGNMFEYVCRCKYSESDIVIIYQDLRSGDSDDDNRKRFQIKRNNFDRPVSYFYVGGYKTGEKQDDALLFGILSKSHNINARANTSSYWIQWEDVLQTYNDGVHMFKMSRILNFPTLGCDSKHVDILKHALITRSLDPNVQLQHNAGTALQDNDVCQRIYFGAPGSGKSFNVDAKVKTVYPSQEDRDLYTFRTTFHPDSDYASFVGCYKPSMSDDVIKYEFVPQVFTEAYISAWQNPDKQIFLIIEEINRGNCAQIFGDLFQLLDRGSDGRSMYPINADKDLAQYLRCELDENSDGIAEGKLCLPSNLNILATMNTSDQSLFPMDSAFKRRWDWKYVPVNYSTNVPSGQFIIVIGDKHYKWIDFLATVNDAIALLCQSEDKQLGNHFVKVDSNYVITQEVFINKVMFYLWNDICKDFYKTGKSFLVDGDGEDSKEFCFNDLFGDKLVVEAKLQGFIENNLKVSPIISEM